MKRFGEQAFQCAPGFLLSCLNILNEADSRYRSSKNQRLTVELALMKMSYLRSTLSMAQVALDPALAGKKKPE